MPVTRKTFAIPALLGVTLAVTLVGRGAKPSPSGPAPLYYVDPMHPQYRSDRPGTAPDCGMSLEPVYANGASTGTPASQDTIQLNPDQEQAIQLETETLRPAVHARTIRTAGRVVPDEALTYCVSAGVDGWIRQVFSDQTGTEVNKGQRLAAFYSKEVSSPQQAYLYALESFEKLQQSSAPPLQQLALAEKQLGIARQNLEFAGMGESQIEQLGRTRRETFDIDLSAPAAGQILERNVAVGRRFMKGETLYRIADLSRVWVQADTYSGDGPTTGGKAWIELPGGPPIEAKIASAPLEMVLVILRAL